MKQDKTPLSSFSFFHRTLPNRFYDLIIMRCILFTAFSYMIQPTFGYIVTGERIFFEGPKAYGLAYNSMTSGGYLKTSFTDVQLSVKNRGNETPSFPDFIEPPPDFVILFCSPNSRGYFEEKTSTICISQSNCEFNSSIFTSKLEDKRFETTFYVPYDAVYYSFLITCSSTVNITTNINITSINPGPLPLQHLNSDDRGFWYSYLILLGLWLTALFIWIRSNILSPKSIIFRKYLVAIPLSHVLFLILSFNRLFQIGQNGFSVWYNDILRAIAIFIGLFAHYDLLLMVSKGVSVVRTKFSLMEYISCGILSVFTSATVTILIVYGEGAIISVVIFSVTIYSYMFYNFRFTFRTTYNYKEYIEHKLNSIQNQTQQSSERDKHEIIPFKDFDFVNCFQGKLKLLQSGHHLISAFGIMTFVIHTLYFLELLSDSFWLFVIVDSGYLLVYLYMLLYLYVESGKYKIPQKVTFCR